MLILSQIDERKASFAEDFYYVNWITLAEYTLRNTGKTEYKFVRLS